ncbi:MAG: aldehyde dehydrogenase [Deltaproteobacteria bacterium]|nr:aldehyde dehydrogenase [Deltaproteobacteria bacterium]
MTDLFNPNDLDVHSGHFIDGEISSGGDPQFDVIRPSDLGTQGTLADASAQSVERAVHSARRAFEQSGWATMAPRERAGILRRWADLVDRDAALLARLESSVSCRPYQEVFMRDVRVVSGSLRFFGEYCDKVDGRVTSTPNDTLSLTLSEPWGVVAGIVPWNFPLILSAWKFAPAMAAGNCVVLKPSELTPYAITHVAQLALEAGVPRGVFNILQGHGATAGSALVKSPEVDYITFTGSTATGAQVMADAALHGLKPVSLELGGKSPQVVFADAPQLDAAAAIVAAGATYNAGQVCFAGSRLVIEASIEDMFIEKVVKHMTKFRIGATWSKETTLPPTIHGQQLERIHQIVTTTLSEGAELLCGGQRLEGLNGAHHYAPTLLRGVTPEMTVYREEVFGPVLAVQTFESFDEAVALADHPTFGLAASVHTTDINKAMSAARQIQAGTVWINDWGRRSDFTSPFGGYKQSGHGKDMGLAGFQKYRKQKAVWILGQQPAPAPSGEHRLAG